MSTFHISQRQWLRDDQEPTMRYYIELPDGRRGEANTALQLFDLIVDPHYSDTDEQDIQLYMLGKKMKDIASFVLASEGVRAQVLSGVGILFDNAAAEREDEIQEAAGIRFKNNEPVILDFWNEWTTIASLIKIGYLDLYEKAHLDPEEDRETLATDMIIFDRMYGVPSEEQEYWKVEAEQLLEEPTWIPAYIPQADRSYLANR